MIDGEESSIDDENARSLLEIFGSKMSQGSGGAIISYTFTNQMTLQSTDQYICECINKIVDNISNITSAEDEIRKRNERLAQEISKYETIQVYTYPQKD